MSVASSKTGVVGIDYKLWRLVVYDYVIVGGGSSGCVLANRLSARLSNRVALIEAGPDTPPHNVPETILSEGYLPDYFEPFRYWTDLKVYRDPVGNKSRAEIERGLTPVRYEQPRVMGGGSSVNAQVAVRGLPSDYDEWEKLGASGWSWNDCLPYFRKLERDHDFGGPYHGTTGPISISRILPELWSKFALDFRDTLVSFGIKYHDDAHSHFDDGCFPFPRNNLLGRRVSTAIAYLDNITRRRSNLDIFAQSEVEAIEFEGRQATGICFSREGVKQRIASRNIILCAGAIHSPALLLRAGIGPGAHLSEIGIPILVDRPGIGANLQDHPLVGIGIHLKPAGRLDEVIKSPFTLFARFSSGMDGCPPQDMKLSLSSRLDPSAIGHQFAVVRYGPDKAYSKGRILLRTANFRDEPIVAFNLLSDQRDIARMIEGTKFVYRLLGDSMITKNSYSIFAGAYTNWIRWLSSTSWYNRMAGRMGASILDYSELFRNIIFRTLFSRYSIHHMMNDDLAIEAWIRETVLGNWHACGSLRMGAAHDRLACTDPQGRVYGVDGLRIADASIMPSIPCANTNISTIMLAEKISDAILSGER